MSDSYIIETAFVLGAIALFFLFDWHDKRYFTSKRERRSRAEVVVFCYIVVTAYWALIFTFVYNL